MCQISMNSFYGGWSSQHYTFVYKPRSLGWFFRPENQPGNWSTPTHMKYTHILEARYGGLDDSHHFSFLNMCDFEVNQPFVHYKVRIIYKVGLRGGTSFNIWYMSIIKWWIFHTVLLKIPAVMLLVFFPSINRKIIYNLHTQTGSTISNDQSQDETHQNTPRKINVVPENHPEERDNHLPNHHFQVPC